MMRRPWLSLAILLALGGCQDAAAPANDQYRAGSRLSVQGELSSASNSSTQVHILQQSPTAPPLETYQLSFWAYKQGKASTVTVNYQPAAGDSLVQPFLRFHVPRNSLQDFAGVDSLQKGDSVAVTLTIDPVAFSVDFEPSGLLFSTSLSPTLAICYENADPDLNGDGFVDATDELQAQQLALWYHDVNDSRWLRLLPKNVTTQACVAAPLYHFSEYAVSW